MKNNTFLAGFNGFYGTWNEPDSDAIDDEVRDVLEESTGLYVPDKLDLSDFYKFNMAGYMRAYSINACQVVMVSLNGEIPGLIQDIQFQSIVSPKEYNFSNDSINCEITFNNDLLFDYICKAGFAFAEFIKERYTSCDGFISSYTKDHEVWGANLASGHYEDGHILGTLLEFVLKSAEFDEIALLESFNESNHISDYISVDALGTCWREVPEIKELLECNALIAIDLEKYRHQSTFDMYERMKKWAGSAEDVHINRIFEILKEVNNEDYQPEVV